jgi:hypothetical protein
LFVFLILAALGGFAIGLLVIYLLARRWVNVANAAGSASRDAEIAKLIEQRDAAVPRVLRVSRRKPNGWRWNWPMRSARVTPRRPAWSN